MAMEVDKFKDVADKEKIKEIIDIMVNGIDHDVLINYDNYPPR